MKFGVSVRARLRLVSFGTALAALLVFAAPTVASSGPRALADQNGQQGNVQGQHTDDPVAAVQQDVSPPLWAIAPAAAASGPPKARDEHPPPEPVSTGAPDPVIQSKPVVGAAVPAALGNFDGIGQGFTGKSGTFVVSSAPPDTNGAVGPNHYVQIVNQSFGVFSKAGASLYGPVPTNTLWAGFGGGCQTNNDGDATVVYDRAADRWIISQFSVTTTPYLQCVAVSTTPDPTGAYYRYAFQYNNFPDYPKMGVWSDGYYETFNLFNAAGTAFLGPEVCAYDRGKMLVGAAATQQCFTPGSAYNSLLPANNDGAAAPPAGSPNYLLSMETNQLRLWRFHTDWVTPSATTLTGNTTIPVAAFTPACTNGGACIAQSGTTQKLDSLGDRLMYRLAYRNFGDHESIVASHAVNAGTSVGMRWYEIRSPGTTPVVYQQSTYAPDATYRWMGSIAMDQNGNIGLGFSTSSSSTHPGIHYTGRLAGDPLSTMTQGEGSFVDGAGSQTGTYGLNRWGDYSALTVDPLDDCTFWYTNEYIASNGEFNWHTRIGSFTLPGCGVPDFAVAVTPSSVTVNPGNTASYTVNVTKLGSFAGTVTLTAEGLPAGATATFTPNPADTSSSLAVTTTGVAPGSYPFTIRGTQTAGTLTHTTSATLVVATPDYSLSASPATRSVVVGNSTTYTVTVTPIAGFTGTVNLAASGLPAGASASFNPASTTGGNSTLTVTTTTATTTGTYTVTIAGTSTGGPSHSTTVGLTVQAAAPDFNLSASPTTRTINRGTSTTYAVTVNRLNGFSPTVSLSVTGLPSRTSASFSPNPATGSSTLTVTTNRRTSVGTYTLTVTATGGGLSRTVKVTLKTQ
jgi:hypothetical protein